MTSRIRGRVPASREARGLELERAQRRRRPLLDHRRRRALDEAAQVVAEPGRHRAPGAALEPLDEPADQAHAVLERDPRVALAPVGAAAAGGRGRRRSAAGRRAPATSRAGSPGPSAWRIGQPQRGRDRGGAEVALDPLEDRGERRRAGAACGGRAARRPGTRRPRGPGSGRSGASRASPASRSRREPQVVGVERGLPLLAAAQLVAADRAAVVLARRLRAERLAVSASVASVGPGDLVEDDRALAGRAAARVAVGDRRLEARLAAGGRGERLDRGVEVAQVRRPEDDLGQEPVERRALEADPLALAVDRGARDPAAAPEQVEDDVARRGRGLDPGGDQRGRRAAARSARTPAG